MSMGFSFAVDDRGKLADKGDDKMLVRFYADAVEDVGASKREGRPIYNEVVFVEIIAPGQAGKQEFVAPATAEHKQRFPRQWARFEAGEKAVTEGTPVEVWPIVSRSFAKQLKMSGFHTVEEIANVNDNDLKALGPGGREVRDRAKAFLDEAGRNALNDRLLRERKEQDDKMARLESELADLKRRVLAPAAPDQVAYAAHAPKEAPTGDVLMQPLPQAAPVMPQPPPMLPMPQRAKKG